jgi:hypothetical protein
MKSVRVQPLTKGVLLAELVVFVTWNITGVPFSCVPPRPPFTDYGGNDFGWPFIYRSTNFTPSQWQQMRNPNGSFRLPAGVVLEPTTVFTSQSSVEFTPAHIGWNVLIACAIVFWTGVTLELWLAPGQRIPSTSFWLLALLVCLIVLLSQTGMFYYYCYWPYYNPLKHAMRLAGLTLLFAPAFVLITRKLRMRQLYRARNLTSAPPGGSVARNSATNSPYAPPGATTEEEASQTISR